MSPSPFPVQSRIYFGYWIVAAAFITQFVAVGMQNYVVGAFLTPMTDEFGWSRTEFTTARSIGQLVLATTGFFIGTYIDRYGGRPFIIAGSLILAAAVFSLGGVQTLGQWLLLNGLILTMGGTMIGNLVVNVTLGKWFVQHRGRAVAIAAMGVSLSGILIPPLATWLVDSLGWRDSWRVLGIAGLLLTLPMALVMRRSPEDYALFPDGKTAEQMASAEGRAARTDFDNSMTRSQAMRTARFYLLVLAFGLFQISITTMLLQTIPFLTDAGFGRMTAAAMLSLASIPAFLSKPFWGYMIDRFSAGLLASAGAAITGTAVMAIVLTVRLDLGTLVYASFLLMGVGWGGLIPLQEVIWASFFGRRYLGSVRSMAMPFTFGMSAIGPILVALYYDMVGNYDLALVTIASCNIASALVMYRISVPRRLRG